MSHRYQSTNSTLKEQVSDTAVEYGGQVLAGRSGGEIIRAKFPTTTKAERFANLLNNGDFFSAFRSTDDLKMVKVRDYQADAYGKRRRGKLSRRKGSSKVSAKFQALRKRSRNLTTAEKRKFSQKRAAEWKRIKARRYKAAGKPRSLSGKSKRKPKRWIQKMPLKRGALHRSLGIPLHKRIPLKLLKSAAKKPGKLGRRARLALRFHFMRKNRKKTS